MQFPSLFALRTFVIVSQYLSFTKAAKVLNITQGAVSRQIRQLEECMGKRLFIREVQGLYLTDEGRKVLPYFSQAIEKVYEGVSLLQDKLKLSTNLLINVPPTFASRWLAPRLIFFCRSYPNIALTIMTEYTPETELYEAADCQVRFGIGPLAETKSILLFEESLVLVGSPGFKEAAKDLPRLLNTSSLLHILNGKRRLEPWEHWLLLAKLESQVDPSDGFEFSTMDQVISAAITGMGIALLDRPMIHRELEAGDLVILSPIVSRGPFGYWLDIRPESENSLLVKNFSDWLRDCSFAMSPENRAYN